MASYSNEFSNFPEQMIAIHKFKNVDNSVASIFQQINILRNNGEYEKAQQLIQQNDLGQYCPDANTINAIFEEIFNTQTYAKKVQQSIHFDEDEEPEVFQEDVWISPLR